jgi:hypothetical protein
LATDQTGGQTQIDVNHSSTWLLNPSFSFDLGGGLFVMKAGNSVATTVTFTLYQGTDTTGAVLTSTTFNSTQFCAQVGNCGTFAFHPFFFTTPVALAAGTNYFGALTSAAPDVQSQAYFIKSDSFFASDITGTPVVPSPFDAPSGPAPTPESSSLFLMSAGLGALGIMIRRRKAK